MPSYPHAAVVLIVEDDPDDVFFLETALKHRPVLRKLYAVPDGERALAFLRREAPYALVPRPNLIILDLNLPRMSGLKVLETLKADPDLRSIPVVVLTGSEDDADLEASYDLAATAFIKKPRDLATYNTVVEGIKRFWLETVQLPR